VRRTREGPRRDRVTGSGFPANAEVTRVRTRVAPCNAPDDHPETSGSPACGRIARFGALLPPRIRSRDAHAGARACARAPNVNAGPLLSWVLRPSGACPNTTPGPVYREDTRRTGHPRKTPLRSGRRNRASTPRPRFPEPGGKVGWPPAPRTPADAGRVRAPSRRRPFLPCPPPTTDSVSCSRGPGFGGLRDVVVDRSLGDRSSPLGFSPARRV
jgi:hypothetical protein